MDSSKTNISSPYFTHHSDYPRLILISKPLNGDNYSTWKRAMTLALNSKNKLGFVNGTIKAHSEEINHEEYTACSRCNDMLHSWIINTQPRNLRQCHLLLKLPMKYGKIYMNDFPKARIFEI